jgi:arsenate reductase
MDDVVIYHNPRCSKSRETLALLSERGIRPKVVEYLETPPSAEQIKTFLKALGMKPRQLMRTKEPEYRDLGLDDASLSDDALVAAMVRTPKLIERPIVTRGARVAVGRPPENVLKIL